MFARSMVATRPSPPAPPGHPAPRAAPGLVRRLGFPGLVATGICSMIGASIHIVPFQLQRTVPGIGPWVLPAFLTAAVPAMLAALSYAILASAMPRAGGSYVFASRGLHPYLGFVASFSQWFGLSIAIGVVSYVIPPFLRDVAGPAGFPGLAAALDQGPLRLAVALAFLWTFVAVNLRGVGAVERTLVPLMAVMFVLGGIVVVAGNRFDHADFAAALAVREPGRVVAPAAAAFSWPVFLSAATVLFSSFIGFDAIAQAGGEARNPRRNLPLATLVAVLTVAAFYFLFAGAVYHAVPWQFVAEEARRHDVTAPGLLGYLLAPGWTVAIVAGAAVSLINDLPGMLLAVSRLMFAWAEDGVFPRAVAAIHPRWRTPHVAILASAVVSTLGIVGCHVASDFFLGVDILVTSMLVNFLLMCATVLLIPRVNPGLAARITVFRSRAVQGPVAIAGMLLLGALLVVSVWKDVAAPARAWYYRSTPVWLVVMGVASLVYWRERRALAAAGVDVRARFRELPPEDDPA